MIGFEIFFWWCGLGLITLIFWYVSFSCKLLTLIGVSLTKFQSKMLKVGNYWKICLKKFLSFGVSTFCSVVSVIYFWGTRWPCLLFTVIPVISILAISSMELTCFLFDFIDNTPHVYGDNFKSDWHVPFRWGLAVPENSPIISRDGGLNEKLIDFSGLMVDDVEQSEYALVRGNYGWEISSWRGCICFFMCGVVLYLGFSFPEFTKPTV